jgi:hypothetical protein
VRRFGPWPRARARWKSALPPAVVDARLRELVSTGFTDDRPFAGVVNGDGATLQHRRPYRNDARPVFVLRWASDADGTIIDVRMRLTRLTEAVLVLVLAFLAASALVAARAGSIPAGPLLFGVALWTAVSAGFWIDARSSVALLRRSLVEDVTRVPTGDARARVPSG